MTIEELKNNGLALGMKVGMKYKFSKGSPIDFFEVVDICEEYITLLDVNGKERYLVDSLLHLFDISVLDGETTKNYSDFYSYGEPVEVSKSNLDYYKEILDGMYDLYERKNNDYGSAIEASIRELGLIYTVCLLNNKMLRIKNLVVNDKRPMVDESIRDTLLDMAGYAIETVRVIDQLEREKRGE